LSLLVVKLCLYNIFLYVNCILLSFVFIFEVFYLIIVISCLESYKAPPLYYTMVDADAVVPACSSVAAVVPPVVLVVSAVVAVVPAPDDEELPPADPKLKTNPSGVELLNDAEVLAASGCVNLEEDSGVEPKLNTNPSGAELLVEAELDPPGFGLGKDKEGSSMKDDILGFDDRTKTKPSGVELFMETELCCEG